MFNFQTSIKMKMLGQAVAKYLSDGELDVNINCNLFLNSQFNIIYF